MRLYKTNTVKGKKRKNQCPVLTKEVSALYIDYIKPLALPRAKQLALLQKKKRLCAPAPSPSSDTVGTNSPAALEFVTDRDFIRRPFFVKYTWFS